MKQSTIDDLLLVLISLLLIGIIFSYSSCRTVEKFFSKDKSKVDSTHEVKGEFKNVSKVDSSIYTLKRDSLKSISQKTYERRITIDDIEIVGDAQRFWDSLHKSVPGVLPL